jgi:hypothetical protein
VWRRFISIIFGERKKMKTLMKTTSATVLVCALIGVAALSGCDKRSTTTDQAGTSGNGTSMSGTGAGASGASATNPAYGTGTAPANTQGAQGNTGNAAPDAGGTAANR